METVIIVIGSIILAGLIVIFLPEGKDRWG